MRDPDGSLTQTKEDKNMITYSKEARDSYIKTLTEIQHKLAETPVDVLGYTETLFLLTRAIPDLKKAIEKEWK